MSEELEYKETTNKQLLGCFQIKSDNKKYKLEFYNSTFIKQKNGAYSERTNSSNTPN